MTEKEFLEEALGELLSYNTDEEWLQERIVKFLEEHHKEYLPVYFIKSTANVIARREAIREQAKLKMADFFSFAGLEFTVEVGNKLDEYWDRNLNTVSK